MCEVNGCDIVATQAPAEHSAHREGHADAQAWHGLMHGELCDNHDEVQAKKAQSFMSSTVSSMLADARLEAKAWDR